VAKTCSRSERTPPKFKIPCAWCGRDHDVDSPDRASHVDGVWTDTGSRPRLCSKPESRLARVDRKPRSY